MYQKLLTLCICCCALLTTVPTDAQLFNAPLNPDVEILPPVSAVSSQFIQRIHNKLIGAPFVAPFTGGNPALVPAPLSILPTPFIPPAIPAIRSNFALSTQLAPLRTQLVSVPSTSAALAPIFQQLAPLVSSFGVFSPPRIIPAPLISNPPLFAPAAALTITSARLPLGPFIPSRLRNRLGLRRRPSRILQRRFPNSVIY